MCQSLSDSFVFLDIWDDLWGADFLLGTLCDKTELFIPTWRRGKIFSYESYGKTCLVSAVSEFRFQLAYSFFRVARWYYLCMVLGSLCQRLTPDHLGHCL